MQQRALHEAAVRDALERGLPPPPSPGLPPSLRSSSRSTPSLYSGKNTTTTKNGNGSTSKRQSKPTTVETLVIDSTSSDEDSDVAAEKQLKAVDPKPSSSGSSRKLSTDAIMREPTEEPVKPVVTAPSPPPVAPTSITTHLEAARQRESSLSSAATSPPPPNRAASLPAGPPESESTALAAPPALVVKPPRQQQRSPSPVPPPKPPARTIRLHLNLPPTLPVMEVPEYSVAELARDAGFLDEPDDEAAQDGSGSASGGSGDESGDSEAEDAEDGGSSKKKGKDKAAETEDEKMDGVEQTGPPPPVAEQTGAESDKPPPQKRQRKEKAILGRHGGYDTEDPFVDDTELSLYEPMYYHRPIREGYFVCSGPLEFISEGKPRGRQPGSKNKPKFDAEGNIIPATRKKPVIGPDGVVVPIASTSKAPAGAPVAKPRKSAAAAAKEAKDGAVIAAKALPSVSSIPAFGSGASAPLAPKPVKIKGAGFSPELQVEIDMLKDEIAKEKFEAKKFPPRLRPILVNVALQALKLGEYDDEFFAILPKMFPYNLFTMKKLVKREIFPRRIELCDAEQVVHMRTLETGITASLAGQRADFDASHARWEQERRDFESKKLENEGSKVGNDVEMQPVAGPAPITVAAVPTSDAAIAGEDTTMGSPAPEGEGKTDDAGPKEPVWKFKFTETMRLALYHLYRLEDEKTELTIEKQTLEKACEREGPTREKPYSPLQARRAMYLRAAALWPDGLMSTNHLSREMSITKKKVEKIAADAA
ncbi:hypothetical protein RQP46_010985 [Phenoliferia psychrophenolica]